MKKLFLILLIVCTNCDLLAQKKQTITTKQLEKTGYEISVISDYPLDQLLPATNQAYLGLKKTDETRIFILLFAMNDSLFVQSSKISVTAGAGYACNEANVFYEEQTIKAECQWMKGLTFGEQFTIENHKLKHLKSYEYDLNEAVFKKAAEAEKNKDPIAYCQAYLGAQYYSDLDYRIRESLSMSFEQAMNFYALKKYDQAAACMLKLQTECDVSLSQSVADLDPEAFQSMWGSATLFYLKVGMNEECIKLSKILLKMYPECVGVHLQYGDALYNLGNTKESTIIYQRYVELMTQKGATEKIPARVLDRISE